MIGKRGIGRESNTVAVAAVSLDVLWCVPEPAPPFCWGPPRGQATAKAYFISIV